MELDIPQQGCIPKRYVDVIRLLILNGHVYLSGVLLGGDTIKKIVQKKLNNVLQFF